VYLTQKISEDMLWNIAVNDAGAAYDPLTLLRTRTMFGRPDWMSIYGDISQAIQGGQYLPGTSEQLKTKVGVCVSLEYLGQIFIFRCKTYFCGPTPLAKAIKEATVHHTNSRVEFSFAKVEISVYRVFILMK
jgi:NADPH oxidase